MTEQVEVVNGKTLVDKVVGFGRDSFYMGLGVVDVVQENVQKLVERGQDYRHTLVERCLLYTSPSPRDRTRSRMPSSA